MSAPDLAAHRSPAELGRRYRAARSPVERSRLQIVRIDRESGWPLDESVSRAIAQKIGAAVEGCDAVMLSDYGSGLVTPALALAVRQAAAASTRRRPIPVLWFPLTPRPVFRPLAGSTDFDFARP